MKQKYLRLSLSKASQHDTLGVTHKDSKGHKYSYSCCECSNPGRTVGGNTSTVRTRLCPIPGSSSCWEPVGPAGSLLFLSRPSLHHCWDDPSPNHESHHPAASFPSMFAFVWTQMKAGCKSGVLMKKTIQKPPSRQNGTRKCSDSQEGK